MNEKTFIKKIGLLKGIQPSQKQLASVRKHIFSRIEKNSYTTQPSVWLHYRYALLTVCLLIFAIFLYLPVTQHNLQKIYFTTRIALASNAYEKATVSLEHANAQLRAHSVNMSTKDLADTFTVTKQTDATMLHLHLQGEDGKYSATQCQKLYLSYYSYLESLNTLLQQQKNTIQLEQMKVSVNAYEKNAEKRLQFYKITPE